MRALLGSAALAAACLLPVSACAEDDRPAPAAGAPAGSAAAPSTGPPAVPTGAPLAATVVPVPVTVKPDRGSWFALTRSTRILTEPGSAESARTGRYLADTLGRATGYPLPVSEAAGDSGGGSISLETSGNRRLGVEGYELDVTAASVTLRAARPAGWFRGVQTLRQLLPAAIERRAVQPGPWWIPGGRIVDHPRFAWRGTSLDVARHFFTVGEVKRYIDLISLYKINVLHLHLSDDQGWRIAISRWPRLTVYGGSTEVGGGRGGFYTQRQYSEIVRYAQDRHITVVPEIDVPGHVNAALASYPELNCDGRPPGLYTGTDVGFSALCVGKAETYRFLDDVIGEVAALTPGPYLHVGGDEVEKLSREQYTAFVERVQEMVRARGKRMVGWQEIAASKLHPTSVAQYWNTNAEPDTVRNATRRGTKLVLSPASKVYLDMKYRANTRLGLTWAGRIEVREAYAWDPATLLAGVTDAHVLGVEAPIWTETLENIRDVEFMAFPRLAGVAEVGWSPKTARRWDDYRRRLAAQGPRWSALGVGYYRSPQVPWPKG
jgi:hexosaminidase